MNDTHDPAAPPSPPEPFEPGFVHDSRAHDESLRNAADAANTRAWADAGGSAARQALKAAIDDLAPIADDREACKRVLSALQELFVPIATSPSKPVTDALLDFAETEPGKMLLALATQYATSQSTPKTKVPCNCQPPQAAQPQPTRRPLSCSFCGRDAAGNGFGGPNNVRICKPCIEAMAAYTPAPEAKQEPIAPPAPNEPRLPQEPNVE